MSVREPVVLAAGGLSAMLAMGCANELPFAASQSLRLTPEEQSTKLVLSESDQADVTRTLAALSDGHDRAGRITREPGGRFSDVPRAVDLACAELEMAVVRVHEHPDEHPDGWRFELKTIGGLPGELVVTRVEGPEVYAATATIGRHDLKLDRAEQLLEALRREVQRLGRRKGYTPP